MNRYTTISRTGDEWGDAMATRAVPGLFPISWRHLLTRGREAMKRCILALIAVVLLVYPLTTASAFLDFRLNTLSIITGGAFAVCAYPEDKSRRYLKLNGHEFWVYPANIDRLEEITYVTGEMEHIIDGVDDKIGYDLSFKNGMPDPEKIQVDITRGGLSPFFLPFQIFDFKAGFGKKDQGGTELTIKGENIPKAAAEIEKRLAGPGWEKQAQALIAHIVFTAAIPNYCDQIYYTAETSEEGPAMWCSAPRDGTNNWVPDTGAIGFGCRGRYCDNVRLACAHLPKALFLDYSRQHEIDFFSEENPEWHLCNGDGIVHGIQCKGNYCDDIKLICAPPEWVQRDEVTEKKLTECKLSPWLSEEDGGIFNFGKGNFINGVRCDGSNCDNKQFRVCHLLDVVTFDNPTIEGVRLDWCKDWASNCGKPAADEFCASQDQLSAVGWDIDESVTHTKLVTGGECNHPDCAGFAFIQCKENPNPKKIMQ